MTRITDAPNIFQCQLFMNFRRALFLFASLSVAQDDIVEVVFGLFPYPHFFRLCG